MVAIPTQTITGRDPGLPVSIEAIETYFHAGTAEKGSYAIKSFNDPSAVVTEYGQGSLGEDLCRDLALSGGPVFGLRLLGDVAGVIGAVTKLPFDGSTGTVAITVAPALATNVLQIGDPAGTPVYVNETADFASATAGDVDPFPPAAEAVGDQFAVGFHSQFKDLSITIATSGTVGDVVWKYWNGTAWTALAGVTDGTTSFTAAPGAVSVTWTMPTDWETLSINGETPQYYVVAEIDTTVFTIDPVLTSGFIADQGPLDTYDVKIRIDTTGTVAVGEFAYTLDGLNYSPSITIPTGGIYDIPDSGLRVTFTPAGGPVFFEAGDRFEAATTSPFVSAVSLTSAFTTITAGGDLFAAFILAGRPATAVAGAALFATLDTRVAALATANRPIGAMMDSGVDTAATTKTNYGVLSSARVLVGFETARVASSKPIVGWSNPLRPIINQVASRAAGSKISTHLGRFADGVLTGVTAITYDELKGTDGMSAARFCTLRTWDGFPGGFYINRPNMLKPPGSDFDLWPHRMIMDTAHRTAHASLQQFVNTKIRIVADGTGFIDPAEALRIEAIIDDALADKLLVPFDAEGNRGHVAAIRYIVDLAFDVASNNAVSGKVAIVRDGYAEEVITELGFAATAA